MIGSSVPIKKLYLGPTAATTIRTNNFAILLTALSARNYAVQVTQLLAPLSSLSAHLRAEVAQMGLITLKDGALSCRWISDGNRHISRRWHTQFQLNTSLRHYLLRTIVPQDTAKRAPSFPAPDCEAMQPTARNHPS